MRHFIKSLIIIIRTKRWRVLFRYLWLCVECLLGLKTTRFLGFPFITYNLWHYLRHFEDTFVEQQYFFVAKNDHPLILDCGANIGDTVLYFKWLYPKAKILAFEPNPKSFHLLSKNISRNWPDVKIINTALSDTDQKLDFYIDPHNPGSGLSSLFKSVYNKRRAISHKISVPAKRLSSFITEPVDFLKMDIEGAEDTVLAELARAKKLRFVCELVVEYHHHHATKQDRFSKFLKILEENNFTYSLSTALKPPFEPGKFQDVLIHVSKS